MNKKIWIIATVILLFFQCLLVVTPVHSDNQELTTLKVALYPYIPNRLSLFKKVEALFEKENIGVNVELVDSDKYRSGYYSGELKNIEADVYEIDTVLLADMVNSRKISPIDLPNINFSRELVKTVTRNNKIYAVPHWLCGNFLFYKKGDKEIEKAKTWDDINSILKGRSDEILVNLKSNYALGEWYLMRLSELEGFDKAQHKIFESNTINPKIINNINSIVENCQSGTCRSSDASNNVGYFSRAFISGKSAAYIGYSESIHFGLQHSLDDCPKTSTCLTVDDIAIRALPSFSANSNNAGLGWVDALAISSSLSGYKRELALKFVYFMVSSRAYKLVLEPEHGRVSRYLIPAIRNLKINKAPLYKQFDLAYRNRKVATIPGLNDKLRDIGKKLDCALPFGLNDTLKVNTCE